MPKLLLPVPDTDRTVTRPVVMAVARDLIELTHLPKNTKVILPGEVLSVQQPGSALTQDPHQTFGDAEYVRIEYSDNLVEQEAGINETMEPSNQFLFDDKNELGVYMRPNYTFSEARLTVKYKARDRVSAKRWRDEIRNRVFMGRNAFVHDVQYSYRIPEVFHKIFEELFRLRENKFGYGGTYKDWFETHANPRLTIATNQSGQYDEYLIAESLRRVQGWFDFTLEPEQGEYADNKRNWSISFDYVFQYDRVSSMVLGYPIVIHNQLLSGKYRDRESKFEEQNHTERLSLALHGLRYFEAMDISWKRLLSNGVSIPSFDDFIPTSSPVSTRRVFTALISVPEPDTGSHIAPVDTRLLSLRGLGRYKLHPAILDYLVGEAPYLTKDYASFFILSLYRNRHPAGTTPSKPVLRVDETLTAYTTIELNLRQATRLRLSLVTDPYLVDKDAWDRLRENACALRLIMQAILPWIDLSMIEPIGGECGYVPEDQFNQVLDQLRRVDYGQARWFDTVSTMFVQTQESL